MIPKLDIVPLADIIPVVESDKNRKNLIYAKLAQSRIIRDLIPILKDNSGKMYLPEDASIFEALSEMDIELIPVQLYSISDNIKFHAGIGFRGIDENMIDSFCRSFPREMNMAEITRVVNFPSEKYLQISVTIKSGDEQFFYFRKKSNIAPLSLLNFIMYLKNNCRPVEPGYSFESELGNVMKLRSDSSIRVINLSLEDILATARQNILLPIELIHWDWSFRILGIDYPIDILTSAAAIEDKRQFLYDLVKMRINRGHSEIIRNAIYLPGY